MAGIKVYVDGVLYDSEKHPIILVFSNDFDRRSTASQIGNMQQKEGVRFYSQFPAGTVNQVMFDEVCEKIRSMICPQPVQQLSDRITESQKQEEINDILERTENRVTLKAGAISRRQKMCPRPKKL